MAEGHKLDTGKTRMDLIPPSLLEGVGQVLGFGAKKYADRNWELGIAWSRCYAALLRHVTAWWGGQDLDPETGMSHLWHAGCCLAFLIEFERTHPERDDRPIKTSPNKKAPEVSGGSEESDYDLSVARWNAVGGVPPNRLPSVGGLSDVSGSSA